MENAFELQNVTKKFPDFRLGPLNFNLEPGRVLGFVGPNGSGKTTTIQCITGLLKANSGSIKVFGRDANPNETDWKQDIGYVGDVHVFYENWSGAKNLKFVSQFYENWSDSFAEELVKRFDVPVDKKAKSLSTGNRIKLSLIMALAHQPRLLLLDEPTAGLDPIVRTEVLDVLFSVLENGERSIFYSTHILSDISRLADELAFINEGTIIKRSAKDSLMDSWRKISYRADNSILVDGIVDTETDGKDHRIIVSDGDFALNQLKKADVLNIQETRMTIEEIAVQVLKENKNVAVN